MKRYEARDVFARYVLELTADPPFTLASFTVMRETRPITRELRWYDQPLVERIIDDLWADPPRTNGIPTYLEGRLKNSFVEVVSG
jgi:hypothetical protein